MLGNAIAYKGRRYGSIAENVFWYSNFIHKIIFKLYAI
jgi:hypothetical protein